MGRPPVKAVFDTNILIDLLYGRLEANDEIRRYTRPAISRITWMEVLTGVHDAADQDRVEDMLGFFQIVELDEVVARAAITLRKDYRLKLPDAIIWASAKLNDGVLVTRNSRDFPMDAPDIRVPYQIR
jgi:predicted nucleic acid-binding protein